MKFIRFTVGVSGIMNMDHLLTKMCVGVKLCKVSTAGGWLCVCVCVYSEKELCKCKRKCTNRTNTRTCLFGSCDNDK